MRALRRLTRALAPRRTPQPPEPRGCDAEVVTAWLRERRGL